MSGPWYPDRVAPNLNDVLELGNLEGVVPLLAAKTVPKPTEAPSVQKKGLLPIGSLGNIPKPAFRRVSDGTRPPIRDSDEIDRVLSAPQRPIPAAEVLEALVEKWTRRLELHPGETCSCPIRRLNRPQAWALEEASTASAGVIGSMKVGSGKTGLGVLYAMAFPGVKQAVLLIPPSLRAQFASDFQVWARHFRVPNLAGGNGVWYKDRPVLRVLAYSELSSPAATAWLTTHRPDLIIGDEIQSLADRKSVRSDRFIRYFVACPETRFAGHSGSLTTRSIKQFAHTMALALRELSPLPIDPGVTEDWAGALDPEPPNGFRAAPGALQRLCQGDETPQDAFRRRMTMTPGVITTEDSRLPTKVTLHVRKPGHIPLSVAQALAQVRQRAQRPDGEELTEASEIAACAKQIATGCYMRWRFPHGEPEALILDWFAKRKAFGAELRERLLRRVEHMDSPKLCKEAAERFVAGYRGKLPVWDSERWVAWRDVKGLVRPESDVVWLDDFLVRDAAAWAAEAPSIVWVDHPAFGHKLARLTGMDYFGAGPEAASAILQCDGKKSIVASIKAHGTGRNLQVFNRALIVDVPSDAGIVEQVIGRLYRQGQRRDVDIFRYEHTSELADSWGKVVRNAQYVRATTGAVHVVLFADEG